MKWGWRRVRRGPMATDIEKEQVWDPRCISIAREGKFCLVALWESLGSLLLSRHLESLSSKWIVLDWEPECKNEYVYKSSVLWVRSCAGREYHTSL